MLKTTLCVVTAYSEEFEDVASLSIPSMRRFADTHRYGLHILKRRAHARRGGWMKIEPIIEALNDAFRFVLWLDIDTFVARTDADIREVIEPDIDLQMVWHEPPPRPGGDRPHFNSGVMLIRASDWSRAFFERVWAIGPLAHKWNDQAAIHHALGLDGAIAMGKDRADESSRRFVGRMDEAWNSIPGISTGANPIIRHYAGISDMAERLRLMREDLP